MLNVLRGLDPRTVSRDELKAEVNNLLAAARLLEREIGMRSKNDEFRWGFQHKGSYIGYESMDEAVKDAERTLGEGGRHRITKVYI